MKRIIVVSLIILLFITACSFKDNTIELEAGKYIMQDTPFDEWSWLILNDDNTFIFNRNIATSYVPTGDYSIDDDILVLTANKDEVYMFKIESDALVFLSGEMAESLVDIGAIFKLSSN